jgi:3-(methylthio)propionyl---CoA ligase
MSDSPHAQMARVHKRPLHVHELLNHAARVHGRQEVVSLGAAGTFNSTSYDTLAARAAACAAELRRLGIGPGDAVVHVALSSAEQVAWLYGAASIGAVTHLLNPLFEPAQARALAQAARPRLLLHDTACMPLARALGLEHRGLVTRFTTDAASLKGDGQALGAASGGLDEEAPALVCYSSGTTGAPKAVQYSHRSLVLHAWACAMTDSMGLSRRDRVLPLMQLFHASAWGAPFVCPMIGATLVLAPPTRDPLLWLRCIEQQQVTVLGAVAAHWQALLPLLRDNQARLGSLRSTVIGGTRVPAELARHIQNVLNIEVRQGWGMTETSPLATMETLSADEAEFQHGLPVFGVELAVGPALDDVSGVPLGELMVRGHWVAVREDGPQWLATGDLAALHADGRLEVVDRIEDAVLGAGRIVSSALVEACARACTGVADAALVSCGARCFALAWVLSPQAAESVAAQALQETIRSAFGGWQPDVLVRVDSLPYTPSAKVQKRRLAQLLAADPRVQRRLNAV